MPPLLVAASIVLLEGLSLSALFPVVHKYCALLGGGPAWIGALFALVAAPKVVLNPLWGRCSDRFGRRAVLIASTCGTILASAGWAIAPNLGWLAVSRVVAGVFGTQAVLANAIAADVSPPRRRAGSLAVLGIAFGVAFALGPVIGGFVGGHLGYPAVGWLGAGFQTVSLCLGLFVLRETRPSELPERAEGPAPLRSPLARRNVLTLLVTTMLKTIGLSALISSFGLFTEQVYRFGAPQTGYALGVFGVVGALVLGSVRKLVQLFSERAVAFTALAILAAGFVTLAAAPPLAGFWVGLCLIAIGSAAATPCLTAMLSHCVGGGEQGRVMGLSQSFTTLGRVIGFSLGGLLYGAFGPLQTFASGAGFTLLGAAGLLTLRLQTPPPAEQAPPAEPAAPIEPPA